MEIDSTVVNVDTYSALLNGKCPQPFSVLGLHKTGNKLTLRVWQPDALDIELLDHKDQSIGFMRPLYDGQLFELTVKNCVALTPYQLRIINKKGEFTRRDPYQFKDEAYHAVHFIDHAPQNLYQQVGAQVCQYKLGDVDVTGTRFAVFAPNAMSVSLIGDFNWWNGQHLPMQRTKLGYWVLFVPSVEAGQRYKFEIKNQAGQVMPHKADPVGFQAEQHPSHASIVYDHSQYQWQDAKWQNRQIADIYHEPMSIYEVHLGSWKKQYHDDRNAYLSYRELADDLIGYVKKMGFTHVELMPVSEFPFDGSWGYQPIGLFAPTSRFGDPDEFKYFVDKCHQAEIGVIVDWVPAHFPADEFGLGVFDGTSVYEYEDPRKGWHPDWESYVFDFGKQPIRQYLVASALYWLDKFHIDGLRVDAVASMLYLDYSREEGKWIPNVDGGNYNYEAISLLKWLNKEVYLQFPKAMTIAEESTSFPKVSRPVHEGGLGFGFKWNMGWMNDSLSYMAKDPIHRCHHQNDITFSLVYAWDENFILPLSHDEVVHGKGSMLYKMPGDEWQQAANLRAYLSFMYGHPGKKLNFMGNEIGQGSEWDHDSSIQWHLLEYKKHAGIQQLVQRLNQLYISKSALHQLDHDATGFQWMDLSHDESSVLAFARMGKNTKNIIYCVCNFTPVPREGYRLAVKDAGQYRVILNTDEHDYWGSHFPIQSELTSETIEYLEQPNSICLSLPPLSTLYIEYQSNESEI